MANENNRQAMDRAIRSSSGSLARATRPPGSYEARAECGPLRSKAKHPQIPILLSDPRTETAVVGVIGEELLDTGEIAVAPRLFELGNPAHHFIAIHADTVTQYGPVDAQDHEGHILRGASSLTERGLDDFKEVAFDRYTHFVALHRAQGKVEVRFDVVADRSAHRGDRTAVGRRPGDRLARVLPGACLRRRSCSGRVLRLNVAANGLRDRVRALPVALSDSDVSADDLLGRGLIGAGEAGLIWIEVPPVVRVLHGAKRLLETGPPVVLRAPADGDPGDVGSPRRVAQRPRYSVAAW
jgi:hypothetical protein